MRRFVTTGALALFVALFAGCDQATDTPTEPEFGKKNKVTYDCDLYGLQEQLDALNEATESILMHRPTVKGALSNIDNTARKVCVDDPNYGAALQQYYEFETLINGQNVSKLVGGETARQALLSMAYSFATGGDYNPGFDIPPEALDPDGGLFVIPSPGDIPAEGLELVAGSYEGALRIFPGTFPPEAFPVTIVEYRLPDDYDGSSDGYSFDPYIPLPEIWWFEASVQPDPEGPGLEVWLCLVDDLSDPYLYDRSVIAHALDDDGGVELLEKLLFEDAPDDLNCANAGPYQVAVGPTAPGWLQLAGSVVRPVLKEIFGVKKLNAMYFAGKGLGGRTGSLSPFAPVDVLDQPEYIFSCSISAGGGAVSGNEQSPCFASHEININDGGGEIIGGIALVQFPAGTEVTVTATPDLGFELSSITGCDSGDGILSPCLITMNGNRSVTGAFGIVDTDYSLLVDGTFPVGSAFGGSVLAYHTAPYADPLGDPDFQCSFGDDVIDCLPVDLAAGTIVRLVANPDAGSAFDGWSLDCAAATGNDCWLWMLEDQSATASFSGDVIQIGSSLVITITEAGGAGPTSIVTDNHTHTCLLPDSPCTWNYPELETAVTITATPDGEPSSQYVDISGACSWVSTGQGNGGGSCSFTAFEGSNYSAAVHFTDVN